MKADAHSHFVPEQFGVAIRAGTERVIHMLRTISFQHKDDEDFVVLKVDLRNAFNNVSRADVMRCVESSFHVLLPWVRWCYASNSHLWYQDWILTSQEGVQQGDPLGPLLFAMVIHAVIIQISEEVPNLDANLWYFG